MPWVRIDDHFDEHPKLAKVGPLGWALWVAGLAYCNRNLTDGHIPWSVAQNLVCWQYLEPPDEQGRRKKMTVAVTSGMAGDDVATDRVIDLLVSAGLWEVEEGAGYYVHDYPDYQPLKAQVEEERQAARERMKKVRQFKRSSGEVPRKNSGSSRNPVPVPVPDPSSPPISPSRGTGTESFERVDLSKAQPKARNLWAKVLPVLKEAVTKPNYETWLKNTMGYSLNGTKLVVAARDDFAVEWLSTKLRPLCAKTVSEVRDKPTEIEFVVEVTP